MKTADSTPNTILGIDPGTNIMGYGVITVTGGKAQLQAMGVVRLSKFENHYQRLARIHERVSGLIAQYSPREMSIEAPFFGKNVQSMLKLGRAQGVAMAAAIARGISVTEYEPSKIKLSITGNGAASKEQVRELLRRTLNIDPTRLEELELDATDGLAAAMCHFYESSKPFKSAGPRSWKEFIAKNPDKVV